VTISVLLISHGFQPSYEKAFANGLASNNVKPTLIASDRSLIKDLLPRVEVLNIRGSQDPKRSKLQKIFNLFKYSAKLLKHVRDKKYDAVHMTGTFMTRSAIAGLLECIIYRLTAQKLLMTVHNILPHGRDGKVLRAIYWFVYRIPHTLVVHTLKMKSELQQRFGIPADRIVIMAHGVDDVPATWAEPTPSEKLRVLIFGTLNHYKGVDQFLKAVNLIKAPIEITIAGEARDPGYARLIAALIDALPEGHSIQWHREFIHEEKVQYLFEGADVALLPYRHIDQSGVLFTAFRFGTPLIVTDVGSFKESLPDFAGVVAASAAPTDLATATAEFIASRARFDRSRIREHAKSLSWKNTVSPLLATYATCEE
jgi:glycosyltransferase involved in cell wall biosynthesis